ncbi:MAG: outer membrane protein [Methyloligellaceae bacterium]
MKNVRRTLRSVVSASAILSVFLISPAIAADLGKGLKDAPIAPAQPAQAWRGPYIGGHLGGAFDVGDEELAAGVSVDSSDSEFIGGVHGGMNWQSGAYVFGIEGDISFGDDIEYLSSARGRIGFAANKWLAYFTGGVAFAEIDRTVTGPNFTVDLGSSETGYVVGGGIEVKLSDAASLGVEGLYYGFDEDEDQIRGFDIDNEFVVVRGRLTWHFGAGRGGGGYGGGKTASKY